jgi:hypothetical protein
LPAFQPAYGPWGNLKVIDKADFRVPEFARPGPALAQVFAQLRTHPVPPFRPSRLYQRSADLRKDFGIDAIVHLSCRFGRPNHKVEIVDVGDKTLDEVAEILAQLFSVDPWTLSTMRVDLTADIAGVPVPWFQHHALFHRKQFFSQIKKSAEQELQFVGMGTAVAQTIYAGKKPDFMRIYDKLAEWRKQQRKREIECNRFNRRMEDMEMSEEQRYYGRRIAPTFKEFCRARGYEYREGDVLTRIERQIGGDRIPPDLATLNHLRFAHEFENPFKGFRLVGTDPILNVTTLPDGVPVRDWLAALGLNWLSDYFGSLQMAHSFVRRNSNGNGKRILESLEGCLAPSRQALTIEEVKASFKRSTLAQTSPPGCGDVHLSPTYESEREIAGSGVGVLS